MPTEPVEIVIACLEISLLLGGAIFVFQLLGNRERRERWLVPRPPPPWRVNLPEFAFFVLLIFGCGIFFQIVLQFLLGDLIAKAGDSTGLALCLNGVGQDGGGLVGWLLFRSLQQSRLAPPAGDPLALPPPAPVAAPRLTWTKAAWFGGATLLLALPVVTAFNLGWTAALKQLGLPDEPQDLIEIFAETKSPLVVAGLLGVACVLAPLFEELVFRAGLYRFCRQNLGRNWALLISGGLFGAMHQNLASFLPLALFGMVLALAYEATGSIRVAVIAHGLFNLNTVFIVLAGMS